MKVVTPQNQFYIPGELFRNKYATKLVFFVFFISGSSSFSVIHANVDFKIKSKERIGFVVGVFYL